MIAKKLFSPFKALASPPSIVVSYFSSFSQWQPFQHGSPSQEDNSSEVGVHIWWDLDNCPVPEGVNLNSVSRAISDAGVNATKVGGPVEILAFADVSQLSQSTCKTLFECGVNINHVPNVGKNSACKSLLRDLMLWVSRNPPPAYLFLISSDRDLATTLDELRMKNYNILLASNEAPDVLCSDASMVWRWNDLVRAKSKYFNDHSDDLWFLNYKLPLETPLEPWLPNSSRMDTNSGADNFTPSEQNISTHKKQVHELPFIKYFVQAAWWTSMVGKLISQVIIGSPYLNANQSINQVIEVVPEVDKYNRLVDLLGELMMDCSRILILTDTNKCCVEITYRLRMDGWLALAFYGHQKEVDRNWVLSEFESSRTPILIATAAAARGLDVGDIKCVINYDSPLSREDYIHRIGHAEANGTAFTFFTPPPLSDLARSVGSFGDLQDKKAADMATSRTLMLCLWDMATGRAPMRRF